MKITIKQIFIFCLLIAAPLPWIINIGGMSGLYPYEFLTVVCFFFIFSKRLFSKAKNQLVNTSSLKSITKFGILFIISVLIGLVINFFENSFEGKIKTGVQLKMIIHVIITILVLLGSFLSGFTLFNGKYDLLRVSRIFFIALLVTSVQTLIVWLYTTGGVIARYNYEPPTGLGQGDTAKILILGFFFALLIMSYNRGIIMKSLIVISIIIFGATIISIQNRSAYLMFFIQLFLFVLLINKKSHYQVFFKILSVGVFLYLISDLVLNSQIFTSISEDLINSDSVQTLNKLVVIQDGINMFFNNPVFGVGWGQFGLHTTAEMFVSGIGQTVASPHNGIIQLISETGFLGAFSAIMLCLAIVKNIYHQYKYEQESKTKLFFGVILIIISSVILVQVIQSSHLFPPPTQRNSIKIAFYYWFLIGYALSFMKNNNITCIDTKFT